MCEGEGVGLQTDASVGIAAGEAVFEVAFDGTAYLGELTAYLVMTACLEVDFKEVVIVVFL